MERNDEEPAVATLAARRSTTRWKVRPRRHPRMSTWSWRLWAALSIAAGAALSWAVSQSAPTATIIVRTALGGVFGLAIGMWIVESAWARWFDRPGTRSAAAPREETG